MQNDTQREDSKTLKQLAIAIGAMVGLTIVFIVAANIFF